MTTEFLFVKDLVVILMTVIMILLFTLISLFSQNTSLCDSPFKCSDAEASAVVQAVSIYVF